MKSFFIFLVLTGLCAGVSIFLGKKQMAADAESLKWPVVDGVVSAVNVEKSFKPESRSSRKNNWCAQVVYRYFMNGAFISSSNMTLHDQGADCHYYENDIQRLLTRYPVGATVKVYYNPKKTTQSTLIPAVPNLISSISGLGYMATFILATITIVRAEAELPKWAFSLNFFLLVILMFWFIFYATNYICC